MKVEIFAICESAKMIGNGLTITGAREDFNAPSFPCRFGNLFLIYKLRFEIDDPEAPILKLVFADEDGKVVGEFPNKNIKREPRKIGGFKPNIAIISLSSVYLPKPGEYSVTLIGNDSVLASTPIYCMFSQKNQA